MADAVIKLIAQDLMSAGFISAGKSAQELEARMGGMNAGLEASGAKAKESESSLLDYAGVLAGGVVAGVTAATVAVGALTASFASNAIETQKLATMSGTTVEAFSKVKGAAEDIGVSGSTVQHSLVLMQRGMQATGEAGESFKSALANLGIETDKYAGSATATTDMLLDLQKQFSVMPDGPEKTAAALKVFGRGGAEMLEFLNQSTEGLQSNMKAFDDLGQTVTAADVAMSKDLRNIKNDIMDLAESATAVLARGMMPTVIEVFRAVGSTVDQVFHAMVDQFGGVKGATAELTKEMEALKGPLTSVAVEGFKLVAWTANLAVEGVGLLTAAMFQLGIASNALDDAVYGETEERKKQTAEWYKARDAALNFAATAQSSANAILNIKAATESHTEAAAKNTSVLTGEVAALKSVGVETKAVAKSQQESVETAAKMAPVQRDLSNYAESQARSTGETAQQLGHCGKSAEQMRDELLKSWDALDGCKAASFDVASNMERAAEGAAQMTNGAANVGTQNPFGQGSYAGAGTQTKWTFGTHSYEATPPPGGAAGMTIESGKNWTNANLAGIAAAKAADDWDKQQEKMKSEAEARQAAYDEKHPEIARRKAQQEALDAKKRALQDAQKDIGFNQKMRALDDQAAIFNKRTEVGALPARSGVLNELDQLSQQEALISTRRQVGNFDAMSGGLDKLELLAQSANNMNAKRKLANQGALAAGANEADVTRLLQQLVDVQRKDANAGATDPIQKAIDALAKAVAANPPVVNLDGARVTAQLSGHISQATSRGGIKVSPRSIGKD